jgi:hypothetical protein
MNVYTMTKEDFQLVPERPHFDTPVQPFYSLVIIPQEYMHESGYRCMDYVAVNRNGEPIIRLSGCSDVLEIDGIGGYGDFHGKGLPISRPIQAWKIDCLPCGYLRLFCNGRIVAGNAISSFEIFWIPEKGE